MLTLYVKGGQTTARKCSRTALKTYTVDKIMCSTRTTIRLCSHFATFFV